VLDYDAEAARYDETRGGEPRAEAAATALNSLLPAAGLVLDIGAGTGIVTARLPRPGRRILAIEPAPGMATRAARRLLAAPMSLGKRTARTERQVRRCSATGQPCPYGTDRRTPWCWSGCCICFRSKSPTPY
jgi:SAM-dependent methyltransferase